MLLYTLMKGKFHIIFSLINLSKGINVTQLNQVQKSLMFNLSAFHFGTDYYTFWVSSWPSNSTSAEPCQYRAMSDCMDMQAGLLCCIFSIIFNKAFCIKFLFLSIEHIPNSSNLNIISADTFTYAKTLTVMTQWFKKFNYR